MEITVSEIKSQIHGDRCGTEVTVFSNIPFEQIMLRDGRVQDALALMSRLEFLVNHKQDHKAIGVEVSIILLNFKSFNSNNK